MTYEFNITPVPKPRMVKSDAWRKRPIVLKYWAYKDELVLLARKFEVKDSGQNYTFILPMPKSWSKKKRLEYNGKPHQQKPDVDNLLKAFLDCLKEKDETVWEVCGLRKLWGLEGKIIIKEKE